MSPATRSEPYLVGNFRVMIDGIAASSFSEVLGLDAAIEVVDYRTGDVRLNSFQKLPGLNKFSNVILKRGLTGDLSLWNWMQNGLGGNVQRADVGIALLDQADNPVLMWKLFNAWPCRWSGPGLNAGSSDVAIEELELCYENLEVAVP